MQRYIILLFIISLSSCDKYESWKKERHLKQQKKEMEAFITQSANSKTRTDTIFLGYYFGMTEDECNRHTTRLYLDGKLNYTNHKYHYTLHVPMYNDSADCVFGAEFHNDSLYKLTLSAKRISPYSSDELLQLQITSMLCDKYLGRSFDIDGYLGTKYVRIKDNLKLSVAIGFDDVRIFYEDIPVLNKVNHQLIEEKAQREKKTINDL